MMSEEHQPTPPKHRGGRPRLSTKNTPAIARAITKAVSKGLPLTEAVKLAGIGYSSFCAWRARDRKFAEMLELAIARRMEKHLANIETAADKGEWRASLALLQIWHPDLFSKHRIEHAHVHLGQVNHQFSVPTETLNQIAQARLKYEQDKEG